MKFTLILIATNIRIYNFHAWRVFLWQQATYKLFYSSDIFVE